MSATPKGLGKGLSALMSETYSPLAATTAQTASNPEAVPASSAPASMLPVGVIRSGKFQPRHRFSEEQMQELVASIKANGIMQPILVRPLSKKEGTYEIIAGERRWRACKIAGMNTVPVIIRNVADKQALELALVENIQRQDLSPLEEAAGYQRLMEEFEYTQEQLGATVGKSRSHIANLLRLQSLPKEVKDLLEKEVISMGHARALIAAKHPLQLAMQIVEQGLNVREAELLARGGEGAAPRKARASAAKRAKDPDILALEETLSENLGLKVSINDRGQSGEIMLAYESLTQLDEILRRLGGNI